MRVLQNCAFSSKSNILVMLPCFTRPLETTSLMMASTTWFPSYVAWISLWWFQIWMSAKNLHGQKHLPCLPSRRFLMSEARKLEWLDMYCKALKCKSWTIFLYLLKAGEHPKAVFWLGIMVLTQNKYLAHVSSNQKSLCSYHTTTFLAFSNFLVIFGCIWE